MLTVLPGRAYRARRSTLLCQMTVEEGQGGGAWADRSAIASNHQMTAEEEGRGRIQSAA